MELHFPFEWLMNGAVVDAPLTMFESHVSRVYLTLIHSTTTVSFTTPLEIRFLFPHEC